MTCAFSYKGIQFSSQQLILNMKKLWKTSHSCSKNRINYFVNLEYQNTIGRGEAGLPPKKPGCYLADINDCFQFFQLFKQRLLAGEYALIQDILDVGNYFIALKNNCLIDLFKPILSCLHSFKEPVFRAPISALEFAIFDLWANLLGKPLLQCIYGQGTNVDFKTFYSVSIGERQIEDARQTRKLTPFIKLKFQDDITVIQQTLTQLISENVGTLYVLDANASWSVETTKQVLAFITENNYQSKVYCLEQPFEVDISSTPFSEEWKQVQRIAQKSNIKIMADESFSDQNDIGKIRQFADGVNVKIEKAGGLINAIQSIRKAKQSNMDVWLGTMVSSSLGCTETFMLSPLASYGDLDGKHIIESPFDDGFEVDDKGKACCCKGSGLCVGYERSNSPSH